MGPLAYGSADVIIKRRGEEEDCEFAITHTFKKVLRISLKFGDA